MSRINRWNERTSATRCGGLSPVLVTLGTIGSAEGGASLSPPSEALPGIATYLPIQHIGGPALRGGWSVLDYSTLMGHEAYLIKLAEPVRNLTFYDHFAWDEHHHYGQLCGEGGYPIGRGSAHSNELRQFEITDAGIVIGAPACEYEALLSGRPTQATTADAVDGAKLG